MAFDYIQNGKSKTMLAVGTEPIHLPTFAGFYALNVMHPDTCTPFSGQSGMSIGEGAGAIVLEEYEHAVARGATIYGGSSLTPLPAMLSMRPGQIRVPAVRCRS